MGTGSRVHELHGDPQNGPCLTKTPLHQVTRAEFLANGADVDAVSAVGTSVRKAVGEDR